MYYNSSATQLYHPPGWYYASTNITEKIPYIINDVFRKIQKPEIPYKGIKDTGVGYNESKYKEVEKVYSMTCVQVGQMLKSFMKAKAALKDISELEDNWNENGAEHFSNALLEKCNKILAQLVAEPFVCPTACGAVQFEYEKENGEYLEFEIYEDRIETFFVSKDGEEQEEVLSGACAIDQMKQMVVDFYG